MLFVVGADSELDVLLQGKKSTQQFTCFQVTALDFDTQELIGKIQFKHEILQIEIKLQYLIVAFMNKIIVCDVYSLKHLFKIDTGDEDAMFDSYI